MEAVNKDERTRGIAPVLFPKVKDMRSTNSVIAQPETSNTVDNQPVKDPSPFRFTWKIDRFSQIKAKKLYSDVFRVGGFKWRVLIFPKGNNVDYLSMYLGVADSACLPYGWSRYAQFGMTLVNQIMNKYSVRKDSQHQFNQLESDWGFKSFIPLGELYDSRGYLLNDTFVVEVELRSNQVENGTVEVPFSPLATESKDVESLEEQNKNIIAEETIVDETIDAMIDEDVIAAIDRVLSEGVPLKYQHFVQGQEISKLDPYVLPAQLLQEFRDIAFKEDLVEKLKEGLIPKVNFNEVKEKFDANADIFSSHQLEQVGVVVNLLNNIVSVFEKLENLKKRARLG